MGGEQVLTLVVDPVNEYSWTNNHSQTMAILPRLAATLTAEPTSISRRASRSLLHCK